MTIYAKILNQGDLACSMSGHFGVALATGLAVTISARRHTLASSSS